MNDSMQKNDLSNENLWALACYTPLINVVICLVAAVSMVKK